MTRRPAPCAAPAAPARGPGDKCAGQACTAPVCKTLTCDLATGQCTAPVSVKDGSRCGAGTCKGGRCSTTAMCKNVYCLAGPCTDRVSCNPLNGRRLGVWEALQLQRCVVLCVLDRSGRVLAQTGRCFFVNGLLYLGSIAAHRHLTRRAVAWLLAAHVAPAYGGAAADAAARLLGLLFQAAWLLPLYVVSLVVSCTWYQEIAVAAFEVQQKQQQGQQQQQHGQQGEQLPPPPLSQPAPLAGGPCAAPPAAGAAPGGGGGGGGGMMQALEGTAQEVFRALLFLVFTAEVYAASCAPLLGPVLNVLLLSWLYAFYCFDYHWALQGAALPQRLLYFEQHWAFFAGFGFPCVAATAALPFHVGAAAANLLFPVFILVAGGADPAAAHPMPSRSLALPLVVVVLLTALRPACAVVRDGPQAPDAPPGLERGDPAQARALGRVLRGANRGKFSPGPPDFVKDAFVFTFNDGADAVAKQAAFDAIAAEPGAAVTARWEAALNGAAFKVRLVQQLVDSPAVAAVEVDGIVTAAQTQLTTQSGATWGLDRIDQATRPLTGTFTYTSNGTGVTAYIIDTGILSGHVEFAGRVAPGVVTLTDTCKPRPNRPCPPLTTGDCNGHGTHVAGTVGGTTWGVAKGVTLVPVRVLDCGGSGSWSGVASGIDWVTRRTRTGACVANLSLGGGASSTIDTAISNLVKSNCTVAVAAGNSNADACNYSPSRAPSAITVGATDSTDARASYSNVGTCLDLFAPGSAITSAWYSSSTATNTISGTSMASPHVAGVAALYLARNPSATPADVRAALMAAPATPGVVTNAGAGSPNLLLFTNY
ncbi:Extracellular serine proteinase [Scenedesmus sp. PABB004]|nr:Extracellular serine proteinase [Scenedesmus sp. PABB004]